MLGPTAAVGRPPTYPRLVLRADADQRAQGRQHEVGLARVQQALQELHPVTPEDLLGPGLLPGQHHQVLGSLSEREHVGTWTPHAARQAEAHAPAQL